MESLTYIGQKSSPFIFSMNLKDIRKKDNSINNNKEKENGFSSSLSSRYRKEISQ